MKYFFIIVFFSLMSACEKDAFGNETFVISNCEKLERGASKSSFAAIKLTVENKSNLTLGCWAYIKIKKGNTIIENKSLVFSSLNPGESQIEEAWFSKFDSHKDYDKAEVELQWTIDSTTYSKKYTY
jgi:hypothetical protein